MNIDSSNGIEDTSFSNSPLKPRYRLLPYSRFSLSGPKSICSRVLINTFHQHLDPHSIERQVIVDKVLTDLCINTYVVCGN